MNVVSDKSLCQIEDQESLLDVALNSNVCLRDYSMDYKYIRKLLYEQYQAFLLCWM